MLKRKNKKTISGSLTFSNNNIIEKWGNKSTSINASDITYVKYIYSNVPLEAVDLYGEKDWLKLKSKDHEVNSEFDSIGIRNKIIGLLTYYKSKGIEVKIETIY